MNREHQGGSIDLFDCFSHLAKNKKYVFWKTKIESGLEKIHFFFNLNHCQYLGQIFHNMDILV